MLAADKFKYFVLLLVFQMIAGCSAVKEKSYLWQVKGQGIEFWLVGVSHALPRNEFPLPKSIDQIYRQSSKIVMESDPDKKSPYIQQPIDPSLYKESAEVGAVLLKKGLIHKPIADDIPKTRTFNLPGLFAQALANFDPDYLKIKNFLEDGYDKKLIKRAQFDGKKYSYLETVIDREAAIDTNCSKSSDHLRMTKALAIWMLDKENIFHESVRIHRILASGDFSSFEKYTKKRNDKYDSEKMVFDCLVIPRNKNWIKTITASIHEYSNSLILVGASHLIGKDNLLELLEENGFLIANVAFQD
jgi:uncharacterized protein